MGSSDYLVRRAGGTWAVRVKVPDSLRSRVGKGEIWRSLGTADFAQAKRKKHLVLEHIMSLLDAMKQTIHPTTADLEQIARDYYADCLRTDERMRRTHPEDETRAFWAQFHDLSLAELRRHLAAGQPVLVSHAAEYYLQDRGFTCDENSPSFKHLCQMLTRAEIEVYLRKKEREAGDFSGTPKDELLDAKLQKLNFGVDPDSRKPLTALLPRMHAEKTNIASKTKDEHVMVAETFEAFLGTKKAIAAITKQDVLEFKKLLLRTPANRTMLFPGCTIHEAARRNEARDVPYDVLDAKTIRGKYLGHLKAILNWAVAENIVETNVGEKVTVNPGKRVQKTRFPFHNEDFAKIFSAPMFAGRGQRNAKFWAIVIAAFSGLRAGEIAQLEPDDIVQQNDVWCFRMTEWSSSGASHEKKRIKTGAMGHRYVPLHPELIAIGLVQHAERARAAGHSRLFPDWKATPKGDYSQTVPRWVNRTFLPRVGLNRKGLTFHSFRHAFKDQARSAGVPQEIHDQLTGHAASGVSGGYGQGAGVAGLRDQMAKIKFPVDLSRLHL